MKFRPLPACTTPALPCRFSLDALVRLTEAAKNRFEDEGYTVETSGWPQFLPHLVPSCV